MPQSAKGWAAIGARATAVAVLFLSWLPGWAGNGAATSPLRLERATHDTARIHDGSQRRELRRGERFGVWTLMDVVAGASPYAVLEDFQRRDGHILFVDADGVRLDLPKSLEPTFADPSTLYLGHTREQVRASAKDMLADALLARVGDPGYDAIAAALPPLQKRQWTYNFLATPNSSEKIAVQYGGRTPTFDPAVYHPSIEPIRKAGRVWDGLVGGYLPVLRFVYPEENGDWTEMLAYAPFRIDNGNDRVQPAWYRVSRIEGGSLRWSRYFDSYHPFPPRVEEGPSRFYRELAALKSGWDDVLAQGMKIDLPDARMADMARHGLVRAIMTRAGEWPKYGVYDVNYGGSEHDGFPDTFTVETAAMLDWGLVDRAGRYIDNYFGHFVRDDGSILYRGPETGQFGRMLTVLAQYVDSGGDPALLLKYRRRIDGITSLLLGMRATALELPAQDPAYGMLSGWSEADSALEVDPDRYVRPYFSNSTEAARGFRDLGRVWERLGTQHADASLVEWGQRLQREAATLRKDLDAALARSILTVDGRPMLPAIAGVDEPFHVAAGRDSVDPQYRSYRAYMEMLYSGNLTAAQAGMIFDYRARHHDVLLGVPTAYGVGTGETAGFLAYGHGYGLVRADRIREALLMTYSGMAHQYTRGGWMAPETRRPLFPDEAAPYCTPAQLFVPLMARWLMVFEEPETGILWLGRGLPRTWLADGQRLSVSDAPTRWGRVGFTMDSHIDQGTITANVHFPQSGVGVETRLRLRAGEGSKMQRVVVAGKPWTRFDPAEETILLPAGLSGDVRIEVHYR